MQNLFQLRRAANKKKTADLFNKFIYLRGFNNLFYERRKFEIGFSKRF